LKSRRLSLAASRPRFSRAARPALDAPPKTGPRTDGEKYPQDGCAITLSVLLQEAGIDVPDTYMAIDMSRLLQSRGWTKIVVGGQQNGDVGSTCGEVAHHGTDHVYVVLRVLNPDDPDEMVVADNQEAAPHFRFASGMGKSPSTYFLRAPHVGA
jgi:hypothetical protein